MQVETIILVEDDQTDTELARVALAQARVPHVLVCLRDGRELLMHLQAAERLGARSLPRLIVLDLNLPDTESLELITRIKQDPELRHIPLVVFSSNEDERLIREVYARNANAYTKKPLDLSGFTQVLRLTAEYWLGSVTGSPLLPIQVDACS